MPASSVLSDLKKKKLWFVTGKGGVGKTTLLEQFRHTAHHHNVLTALVNEDQSTILMTLAYLAQELGEAGHPCDTFNAYYRK